MEFSNQDHLKSKESSEKVDRILGGFFFFLFLFDLFCGLLGIAAYMRGWDKVLYIDTAVVVVTFVYIYWNNLTSFLGLIWPVAGAALGYYGLRSFKGLCLGIMLMLVIRHLFKEVLLRIVAWLSKIFGKL